MTTTNATTLDNANAASNTRGFDFFCESLRSAGVDPMDVTRTSGEAIAVATRLRAEGRCPDVADAIAGYAIGLEYFEEAKAARSEGERRAAIKHAVEWYERTFTQLALA